MSSSSLSTATAIPQCIFTSDSIKSEHLKGLQIKLAISKLVSEMTYKVLMGVKAYSIEGLRERTEHLNRFLFPPITQWCSISDVLFTGGRRVSDFSVLKYY